MNERSNILLGIDINNDFSQISYFARKEGEPASVSSVAKSSQYQYPTVLCKRYRSEEWYYGMDAVYFTEIGGGTKVENLLELCGEQQDTVIEGKRYASWELLAIFLELSLLTVNPGRRKGAVTAIMFTTEQISKGLLRDLERAFQTPALRGIAYRIQEHMESFYYYVLNQKKDLWNYRIGLFLYKNDRIYCKTLHLDRSLKPVVAVIEEDEQVLLGEDLQKGLDEKQWNQKRDTLFYNAVQRIFEGQSYSSVFLIGEKFDKEWMDLSLTFLCNRRKAFQGENLFAKGACYAVRENFEEPVLKEYLYKGHHMIYTNIGMEMVVRGKKSYHPLIEAGQNWYEAKNSCEFILDEMDEVILQLDAIDRSASKSHSILMPNLPSRPRKATRLKLDIVFQSKERCRVTVEDLGFGEFYPSVGKVADEIIEV